MEEPAGSHESREGSRRERTDGVKRGTPTPRGRGSKGAAEPEGPETLEAKEGVVGSIHPTGRLRKLGQRGEPCTFPWEG